MKPKCIYISYTGEASICFRAEQPISSADLSYIGFFLCLTLERDGKEELTLDSRIAVEEYIINNES